MSGVDARVGFAFQDLVLAERVLKHLLEQRTASIVGTSLPEPKFFVEASPSPGQAPEWDLIQSDGTELVLEEAKSGEIKAEDRWVLWRRMRRTLGNASLFAPLTRLRLVVNADNLPTNPEHWRTLVVHSQRVTGTWFTPKENESRRRVMKAEDLANEALHVLTSADADLTSKPLDMLQARRLLANFSFEESAGGSVIEGLVRGHLSALSRGLGVDELLSALRGEISRRAEADDTTKHHFTSGELLKSLSVLERLATIDPNDARLWRSLRDCATANLGSARASTDSGLPYQDWRTIHPNAHALLGSNAAQAVAVLGRGGLGKSVLLREWLTERQTSGDECLFLSSADLVGHGGKEIAAALELGLFIAQQRQAKLCVGIDAIENVASKQERAALLAALRGMAASGALVCVTSRLLEWRSSRGSSEKVAGWHPLELEEWPEPMVQAHVGPSDRPNVGDSLRKLLRTPLLLDLFIRTFGQAGQVPQGLQTRHGLISAYWNRRIWPDSDARSSRRRNLIIDVATREASGVHAHSLAGDEADDLASEGLFVLGPGGRSAFRHALLRDYAMGEWLNEGTVSAKAVSDKLSSVSSPLLQFGTLRACLEKAVSNDAEIRLAQVLRELAEQLLSQAGTILGEFDDVSEIDVVSLVDSLRPGGRAPFLSSLLASVKLAHAGPWLELLSRLPADSAWAESKPWLTGQVLSAVHSVVESFSKQTGPRSPLAIELASRLRAWTSAPRVRSELAEGGGWHLGRLVKSLVELDPSESTAHWILDVAHLGESVRFWILSELPKLARSMPPASDKNLLRRIYLAAGQYREEEGMLKDEPGFKPTPMGTHDRIVGSLIDDGKGLLSTHPVVFVRIAAELLAGHEQELADEDAKRDAALAAAMPEVPDTFNELLEQTRNAERWQAVKSAFALAVQKAAAFEVNTSSERPFSSARSEAYWDLHYSEYHELLLQLRDVLSNSLASGGNMLSKLWPGIRSSASGRVRACVLDLLTRADAQAPASIVDELLQDQRMYVLGYAQPYLQRGIEQRWTKLPKAVQATILNNIRYGAKPPQGNAWSAGPLYNAIVETERPPESATFIELTKVAESPLKLPDPESDALSIATPKRIESPPRSPIGGLSSERQVPWTHVAALPANHISACGDEQWAELVPVVRTLVVECLPRPDHLLEQTDLLERLAEFVDAQRERTGIGVTLEVEHLESLANWGLSALSFYAASELGADCEPFEGLVVGLPPKAEYWMAMARLVDRLLWHPKLVDRADLNDRLFEAVGVFRQEPPDRIAYYLFTRITGWFRGNNAGRPILKALLLDEVRNGHALDGSFWLLRNFTAAEQDRILSRWFIEDIQPGITRARQLVRKGGVHVGCVTLVRDSNGKKTGSNAFLWRLLAQRPTDGLLSDPALYDLFVAQAIFGAKQALINDAVPLARASEYFELVLACWNVLLPAMSEEPSDKQAAVALWAVGPILETDPKSEHALKTTDRMAWFHAALPLALKIISEGPWQEISHLIGDLSDTELRNTVGIADIKPLLLAFDDRVKTLPSTAPSYRWDHALSRAAALIDALLPRVDPTTSDWMFEMLTRWAAPPTLNETAREVARDLREAR